MTPGRVRGAILGGIALAVSAIVHLLLGTQAGRQLGSDGAAGPVRAIVVEVEPQPVPEPDIPRLIFEESESDVAPETLLPEPARVVPPPDVSTALRAARGGGGSSVNLNRFADSPIPVTAPGAGLGAGTGLSDAADRFATYLGQLRETGLDVVFVIDATGTMDWTLGAVKREIRYIVDYTRSLVPIARFGLVAYRDVDDPGFVTRIQSLTFSTAKLERFLVALDASGGGSLGEAVDAGLATAIDQSGWRPDARRLIILIGDAPPHQEKIRRTLALARSFHAIGGQITTLDVSDDANPRLLESRLGRPVNRGMFSATPSYAFRQIAEAGGGDAATLDQDVRLTRRLVKLVFGDRFGDEIEPLLAALET